MRVCGGQDQLDQTQNMQRCANPKRVTRVRLFPRAAPIPPSPAQTMTSFVVETSLTQQQPPHQARAARTVSGLGRRQVASSRISATEGGQAPKQS